MPAKKKPEPKFEEEEVAQPDPTPPPASSYWEHRSKANGQVLCSRGTYSPQLHAFSFWLEYNEDGERTPVPPRAIVLEPEYFSKNYRKVAQGFQELAIYKGFFKPVEGSPVPVIRQSTMDKLKEFMDYEEENDGNEDSA